MPSASPCGQSLVLWLAPLPIRIVHEADVLKVQAVAPNIVRVHFQPGGKPTPRALVMDNGKPLRRFSSRNAFRGSSEPGWFSTTDKFGAATEVRLPVDGKPQSLLLSTR